MILEENYRRGKDQRKLYLLYDQMYWTLTFGNTRHYNPVSLCPEMKEYAIFIDGISKAFAATGVRVGWALGPEKVLSKMKAINSHIGAWSPMAEQHATAKFLSQNSAIDAYLTVFKRELEERLHQIFLGFQQLKKEGLTVDALEPQAAIYLTIQISLAGKKTAEGKLLANQGEVTSYILQEAKLAVVPFSAFGAPSSSDWYRLSVGTCRTEEIPEMIGMLRNAISKLQ